MGGYHLWADGPCPYKKGNRLWLWEQTGFYLCSCSDFPPWWTLTCKVNKLFLPHFSFAQSVSSQKQKSKLNQSPFYRSTEFGRVERAAVRCTAGELNPDGNPAVRQLSLAVATSLSIPTTSLPSLLNTQCHVSGHLHLPQFLTPTASFPSPKEYSLPWFAGSLCLSREIWEMTLAYALCYRISSPFQLPYTLAPSPDPSHSFSTYPSFLLICMPFTFLLSTFISTITDTSVYLVSPVPKWLELKRWLFCT